MMKFKTNIKCNGCISAVTPFLNSLDEIKSWSVDLGQGESTLIVEGEVEESKVTAALESAGYSGERIA